MSIHPLRKLINVVDLEGKLMETHIMMYGNLSTANLQSSLGSIHIITQVVPYQHLYFES